MVKKICSLYQEELIDAELGYLNVQAVKELELHLSSCVSCREQMTDIRQLLGLMDEKKITDPPADKAQRFQIMLQAYKDSVNVQGRWRLWFEQAWQKIRLKQLNMPLAFAMMALITGSTFAVLLFIAATQRSELKALTAEVTELKKDRLLNLLDNPEASERIRGISFSAALKDAGTNAQVTGALLATLYNDPNVNVRLMALEMLADHFGGQEPVREGLVKSIVMQDSPIIQAALAEVMIRLQYKNALPALRTLLNKKELEEPVRRKVTQAVSKLI